MNEEGSIVNRVAQSGLITLNLEDFLPDAGQIREFDLMPFLFRGLLLKEKEFRAALKDHDWSPYQDRSVAVFCSADAIVPQWTYMLVATYLEKVKAYFVFGNRELLESTLILERMKAINVDDYRDQRVVIKGCGDVNIPGIAYVEITRLLTPVVKSLFYGEPCSTVPVYKKA